MNITRNNWPAKEYPERNHQTRKPQSFEITTHRHNGIKQRATNVAKHKTTWAKFLKPSLPSQ